MRVLAGDIGGTKTLLQLAECSGDECRALREHRYDSHAWDSLHAMAADFLAKDSPQTPVDGACFAVAGPVADGPEGQTADITNLPWRIQADTLTQILDIPAVRLINDFQAVGYGIDTLADSDLLDLQAGSQVPRGPRAILGAGTGLGVCLAYWAGSHYETVASEGGHADFAPADDAQLGLWQCLHERFGHVSWERLVSGPGLVNIFRCLAREAQPDPALVRAMEQDDPAAAIARFALEHQDPLAARALTLFVSVYGAQAGNLALTALATGGVYVAGGIAPKIRAAFTDGTFLEAFTAKGRMGKLLARIPVRVVLNPGVGLLGARLAAARLRSSNK